MALCRVDDEGEGDGDDEEDSHDFLVIDAVGGESRLPDCTCGLCRLSVILLHGC